MDIDLRQFTPSSVIGITPTSKLMTSFGENITPTSSVSTTSLSLISSSDTSDMITPDLKKRLANTMDKGDGPNSKRTKVEKIDE